MNLRDKIEKARAKVCYMALGALPVFQIAPASSERRAASREMAGFLFKALAKSIPSVRTSSSRVPPLTSSKIKTRRRARLPLFFRLVTGSAISGETFARSLYIIHIRGIFTVVSPFFQFESFSHLQRARYTVRQRYNERTCVQLTMRSCTMINYTV